MVKPVLSGRLLLNGFQLESPNFLPIVLHSADPSVKLGQTPIISHFAAKNPAIRLVSLQGLCTPCVETQETCVETCVGWPKG